MIYIFILWFKISPGHYDKGNTLWRSLANAHQRTSGKNLVYELGFKNTGWVPFCYVIMIFGIKVYEQTKEQAGPQILLTRI